MSHGIGLMKPSPRGRALGYRKGIRSAKADGVSGPTRFARTTGTRQSRGELDPHCIKTDVVLVHVNCFIIGFPRFIIVNPNYSS